MSENSDKEGVESESKATRDATGKENAAATAAEESQVLVKNMVEKQGTLNPEENPAKERDGDGVADNAVKEKDGSATVENPTSENGGSTPAAIPTNGLDSTPSAENVLNEKASPANTGTLIRKEDKLDPTGSVVNVQKDSAPKENKRKDSGVLDSSPQQHLSGDIGNNQAAKINNGGADHDDAENIKNADIVVGVSNVKPEKSDFGNVKVESGEHPVDTNVKEAQLGDSVKQDDVDGELPVPQDVSTKSFFLDMQYEGDGSGTDEEQAAFMKELETFHKEMNLEFKPPKFYGEGLNCLKLWRAVTRLGGYDQVTLCKLWRQVGESFNPPKTCTTVSWSFRCFYEKALLEYEKHKIRTGELQIPVSSYGEPMIVDSQPKNNQTPGSGRAIRESAARAMQGWHSQRLLGSGEVGDPIIKDKTPVSLPKRDKHLKSIGSLKRKKTSSLEHSVKAARRKIGYPISDTMVVDVGPPADWVKINVRRTKDCFEVYALVPGLLREEVHVQSDPAGRLVISGEPEQLDNPWGVTPFKKIVTLPSRIDPHQTSAVVTLHGQLFVRAPFEITDA